MKIQTRLALLLVAILPVALSAASSNSGAVYQDHKLVQANQGLKASVPDSGGTLLLLGSSLVALVAFRQRIKSRLNGPANAVV